MCSRFAGGRRPPVSSRLFRAGKRSAGCAGKLRERPAVSTITMRTSSSITLPDYEVYAIRYARMPRDLGDNFFGGDPH